MMCSPVSTKCNTQGPKRLRTRMPTCGQVGLLPPVALHQRRATPHTHGFTSGQTRRPHATLMLKGRPLLIASPTTRACSNSPPMSTKPPLPPQVKKRNRPYRPLSARGLDVGFGSPLPLLFAQPGARYTLLGKRVVAFERMEFAPFFVSSCEAFTRWSPGSSFTRSHDGLWKLCYAVAAQKGHSAS